MNERSHHAIRESIRERIAAGEWAPGALMPGEADLAEEYDCARVTVNRALQTLAEDGIIERKRRAGTRVKETPVRRARFDIPLIRHEVEASGARYRPRLLRRDRIAPPLAIARRLGIRAGAAALHLETAHMADDRPYAYEDRWVNLKAAPAILDAPLDEISANEWLIRHAPWSSGDVSFSAEAADPAAAAALGVAQGAPLFVVERATWFEDQHITVTRLFHPPGYRLRAEL